MRKFKMNKKVLQVIAAVAILLVMVAIPMVAHMKSDKETTTQKYVYSVTEQVLADEVIVYLQNAAALKESVSAETAHEAVESYNAIIRSDIDVANEDHTKAIQEKIKAVLRRYADVDSVLSDEQNITALSAGVAEIVWQTVLSQIETVTENLEESDYFYLAESLQEQIRELEDRKMKISIKANIKNNTELTPEELLSMIDGMSDSELEDLARAMGFSYEELYDLINSAGNDSTKEIESRLETMKKEIISELKKELTKELTGSGGANGKDGRDGRNGQDGNDGKDGETGKDGSDGKTTYIAYADDASGNNFSLTPRETSKYIGTCITKEKTQPTDRASYGNWQTYRSHVITETTENGVTTVHIN